jgi:hypothetical protein
MAMSCDVWRWCFAHRSCALKRAEMEKVSTHEPLDIPFPSTVTSIHHTRTCAKGHMCACVRACPYARACVVCACVWGGVQSKKVEIILGVIMSGWLV